MSGGSLTGPTTAFLDHFDDPSRERRPPGERAFAFAALASYLACARALCEDESFIGWRSGGPIWSTVVLAHGELRLEIAIRAAGRGEQGWRYQLGGEERELVEVVHHRDGELSLIAGGVRQCIRYALDAGRIWIDDGREVSVFEDVTYRAVVRDTAGTGKLCAPLDGKVIDVRVEPGARVEKGQVLLIIEAMKMEHRVAADIGGVVVAVNVAAGNQVKIRQPVIDIEAG